MKVSSPVQFFLRLNWPSRQVFCGVSSPRVVEDTEMKKRDDVVDDMIRRR